MPADAHRNDLWRWVGPALRRMRVRNYRSIAGCDVSLAPMTVMVGRNGAGKSNLLDVPRFVCDAVRDGLGTAIERRGGISGVRRHSQGHPRTVSIDLELRLASWHVARYGFDLVTRTDGGFAVATERASIVDDDEQPVASFVRDPQGAMRGSHELLPPADPAQLYLPRAAGLGPFRELYRTIAAMIFLAPEVDAMRTLRPAGDSHVLATDGSNLASVIARLVREQPAAVERVVEWLAAVQPGIVDVARAAAGPLETVRARQRIAGARHPWKVLARDMADGTLQALGLLIAAVQDEPRVGHVSLLMLEAPERNLHPQAVGVVTRALAECASHTQVFATSHSADLVDNLRPGKDRLLAVSAHDGTTAVATVRTEATPWGEALRQGWLVADEDPSAAEDQLSLF